MTGAERVERAAPAHAVAKQIDLLAEHPQVVHESVLRNAGREREEAAVRIDREANVHRPRHTVDRQSSTILA